MAGRLDDGYHAVEPGCRAVWNAVCNGWPGGDFLLFGVKMDFLPGMAVRMGHWPDHYGAGGFSAVETLPLQIAAAMLVGVWYVGVFLNIVRNRMLAFLAKRQKP